jgi:hypothetical protein
MISIQNSLDNIKTDIPTDRRCMHVLHILFILCNRNFYGRSGVCLALHITPEKPSGWEYSVFVFLCEYIFKLNGTQK